MSEEEDDNNADISVDFDLDALFREQSEQESLDDTKDTTTEVKEDSSKETFTLHLPPTSLGVKRSAPSPIQAPPSLLKSGKSDIQVPDLKRLKYDYIPSRRASNDNKPSAPALLLPEDIVDSGPVSSHSDSSIEAVRQMKLKMISSHTLLTTHIALQRTTQQVQAQLAVTRARLDDANRWKSVLTDENSRLRTRVGIVGREEARLRTVVKKLNKDTLGDQKHHALRNEIWEKNQEIARLLLKCKQMRRPQTAQE